MSVLLSLFFADETLRKIVCDNSHSLVAEWAMGY